VDDVEVPARAGVGDERAERVAVADDGDPAAGRQRLAEQELRDVEHLPRRLDPDAAALPQHRVERLLRRAARADGVARAGAEVAGAGLHDDDGFARASGARCGELARVADALQVEADDVRRRVLLPVLEAVVAGDVGAVAGGQERREADAAPADGVQDGDAQPAGLREQPEAAVRRHRLDQGDVEPRRRVGVDQPPRVRAD
jgi:hypothetical protein